MDEGLRWLTYTEIAAERGITLDAAKNLARRRRWARRAGNDGKARIGVPAEMDPPIDPPSEPAMHPPIITPANPPAVIPPGLTEVLDARIVELRELLAAERARGDRLETLALDAVAGRARAEGRVAELETRLAEAQGRRSWWQRLIG